MRKSYVEAASRRGPVVLMRRKMLSSGDEDEIVPGGGEEPAAKEHAFRGTVRGDEGGSEVEANALNFSP